jgi:hypothetical protein
MAAYRLIRIPAAMAMAASEGRSRKEVTGPNKKLICFRRSKYRSISARIYRGTISFMTRRALRKEACMFSLRICFISDTIRKVLPWGVSPRAYVSMGHDGFRLYISTS